MTAVAGDALSHGACRRCWRPFFSQLVGDRTIPSPAKLAGTQQRKSFRALMHGLHVLSDGTTELFLPIPLSHYLPRP
jgi:hypothetical protein